MNTVWKLGDVALYTRSDNSERFFAVVEEYNEGKFLKTSLWFDTPQELLRHISKYCDSLSNITPSRSVVSSRCKRIGFLRSIEYPTGTNWSIEVSHEVQEKPIESWVGEAVDTTYRTHVHDSSVLFNTTTERTNKMLTNKSIAESFEKTQEAILVQEELGSQIPDNWISKLVLADKTNKEKTLKEAKRLQEERSK